ncbi:Glycine receptor subunit alpha-1 [Nymphon striatum]|nr:Glycine receptor subunit alpha-1 [Nymphon striatum]
MDYTMDVFLRQQWEDPRLRTKEHGINSTLTINKKSILHRIWKPDLYFHNVKSASFHEVTVPNILIRISPDGTILYSMRLKLTLSCHMSLVNYPLDTQRCMVVVGSLKVVNHIERMVLKSRMRSAVAQMIRMEDLKSSNMVLSLYWTLKEDIKG